MRIQSSHPRGDRGLDAYFSPPEAVAALLRLEADHLPSRVWEPAAGDGAIVRPLRAAGFEVVASDVADYGLDGCEAGVDYPKAAPRAGAGAVVTNSPYRLAARFAAKALEEVPYLALLLRTNFLEGAGRLPFFRRHPPARVWVSSRRLPMMHRHGWQGRQAASNTCHAWLVWDARAERTCAVGWFDWKEAAPERDAGDLLGGSRGALGDAA